MISNAKLPGVLHEVAEAFNRWAAISQAYHARPGNLQDANGLNAVRRAAGDALSLAADYLPEIREAVGRWGLHSDFTAHKRCDLLTGIAHVAATRGMEDPGTQYWSLNPAVDGHDGRVTAGAEFTRLAKRAEQEADAGLPKGPKCAVVLGATFSDPVIVLGKPVCLQTDAQYRVVKGLIEAGPDGLAKTDLTRISKSGGAVNVLKRLAAKKPWKQAIRLPGTTGGHYRLKWM